MSSQENSDLSLSALEEMERLEKEATPGPWNICNSGDCPCKAVWCSDHPVAKVTHGNWGDDYPSLRLVGGSLDRTVEAYMEQITYGSISNEVATANGLLMVHLRNHAPALLTAARENDRLKAEIAEYIEEMQVWIDFADKHQKRVAELEAALKPFAEEAENWDPDANGGTIFADSEPMGNGDLTVGDLRRARAALGEPTDG